MNWFYDWNHNTNATKSFVKRTLDHWTQNYHIDGFRWDFTQGLVQTQGGRTPPTTQAELQLFRSMANTFGLKMKGYI